MEKPSNIPVEAEWYDKFNCWQLGKKNNNEKKIGKWEYWRQDGSKYLELSFSNCELNSLIRFDKNGNKIIEEVYENATYDLLQSLLNSNTHEVIPLISTIVYFDNKKIHFKYKKDICSSIEIYVDKILKQTYDFSKIQISNLDVFNNYFNEIYTPLLGKEYRIVIDNFSIDFVENEIYDDYFKVCELFGDGAGDYLIIILEKGKFFGEAYVNDHEEGLFSMECIDEFIEEEGLENIKDKNELIQNMPFFEEDKIAENLDNLFKMLKVYSNENYVRDVIRYFI